MTETGSHEIYTHPTLRNSDTEFLLRRLQDIRDRRLVAALLHERDRVSKAQRLGAKLHQQWLGLQEKNRLAIFKIDEQIDKLERSINKQIEISHQLAIVEDD